MTPDIAVVSEEFPEDKLLGRIVFFSIPDEEIKCDDLIRAWTTNGLDAGSIPDIRQPVHVFQSACASIKQREGNGHGRVEIRSDEVENTPTRCSYQITLVIWNLNERTIEHEKGLRIEFDKITQRISAERLDHYDPALEDLERRVRQSYTDNLRSVPSSKVRNAIRNLLLEMGAQNLRRRAGGVYFVPREAVNRKIPSAPKFSTKPILDGLTKALDEIYGVNGDLHTLPCINGQGERNMVARHFSINASAQARQLAAKAFERIRSESGRKVREDFVANLNNERRVLLATIAQFREMVDVESNDINLSLGELDDALAKLDQLAAGS